MKLSMKDETARIAKNTKVFLNDQDITTKCFEADDAEGYANVYLVNEFGYTYLWWKDTNEVVTTPHWRTRLDETRETEPAWERLEGVIRFEGGA